MGFVSPDLPQVDVVEWRKGSRAERVRPMARHIAERGMGYPDVFYLLYLVKIGLYILGGLGFALATTGIDGWGNIATWWNEPIVFQKVVLWSLLFEVLGLGCGFGPLTGKIMPPMGSPLYWLRTGTIRLPPWPGRIPFTTGDRRTVVEVVLYAALLAATLYALLSNGAGAMPELGTSGGLIPTWKVALVVVILAVVGLRDKLIFLAARGEVYGTLALTFLFPGVTMIVAAKLVMLGDLAGCGDVEDQPPLPVRGRDDDVEQSAVAFEAVAASAVRRFPDDLQPGWIPNLRRTAHGDRVRGAAGAVLLPGRSGHVCGRGGDDHLPPGDPDIDSAGRAAGVERLHDFRHRNAFRRQGRLRSRRSPSPWCGPLPR